MAEKGDYVKEELLGFLKTKSPGIDESGIDEIVLSYMVSILEELGTEDSSDDTFDVEAFTDMMEAYMPGFAEINSVEVSEWMFSLSTELSNLDKTNVPSKDIQLKVDDLSFRLNGTGMSDPPQVCRQRTTSSTSSSVSDGGQRSRKSSSRHSSLSESESAAAEPTEEVTESSLEDDEFVKVLLEMFPGTSTLEQDVFRETGTVIKELQACVEIPDEQYWVCDISLEIYTTDIYILASVEKVAHCLCITNGNVESAAQLLLHRKESGETFTDEKPTKRRNQVTLNDQSMKNQILNKYGFVDTADDERDHKPVGPKHQPKKMVRYLDGKVVSMKGERFTEMKKDEDETMKKTYVNLKPARKYRFH